MLSVDHHALRADEPARQLSDRRLVLALKRIDVDEAAVIRRAVDDRLLTRRGRYPAAAAANRLLRHGSVLNVHAGDRDRSRDARSVGTRGWQQRLTTKVITAGGGGTTREGDRRAENEKASKGRRRHDATSSDSREIP